MNIQRFHAATSREALAKARMTFGDGTLILSNRPTATGVEVVATAEDSIEALEHPGSAPTSVQRRTEPSAHATATAAASEARNPVEEDTEQLAMSTLSFQDYVRERMLRRRHEALHGGGSDAEFDESAYEPAPQSYAAPAPASPHSPACGPAPDRGSRCHR